MLPRPDLRGQVDETRQPPLTAMVPEQRACFDQRRERDHATADNLQWADNLRPNVWLREHATRGASHRKPLFGGTRT